MAQTFLETWARFSQNARLRWRWLGYGLTLLAFVYLAIILVYSGYQVRQLRWQDFWRPASLALALYLLSLLLQLFVWARLLSFHRKVGWRDVAIYSRVLVMRRLPGGVWHWVGRTAFYTGETELTGRVILLANFLEWVLLLLVAAGIALYSWVDLPIVFRWAGGMALCLAALALTIAWQPISRPTWLKAIDGGSWIAVYLLVWVLGGIILYRFAQAAGGTLDLLGGIWVWALSGGSSLLFIIIPAGLGIREITLTWLLSPFLSPANALLIAILIRLAFTLADLIWGSLGLALSRRPALLAEKADPIQESPGAPKG